MSRCQGARVRGCGWRMRVRRKRGHRGETDREQGRGGETDREQVVRGWVVWLLREEAFGPEPRINNSCRIVSNNVSSIGNSINRNISNSCRTISIEGLQGLQNCIPVGRRPKRLHV